MSEARNAKAILALLLLVTAFVRFKTIGFESFWHDEIFTLDAITGSASEQFAKLHGTYDHPPLYFLLLSLWSKIAGASEGALRAFSVVCGLGAQALIGGWLLRRRGEAEAIVASVLIAVHPLLAMHFASARMYALLFLLTAGFLIVLLESIERPSRAKWIALVALACALPLTHYFGVFPVLAAGFGVAISAMEKREKRNSLFALAAGVAIFAAVWGWVAVGHFHGKHGTSWLNTVWGSGLNIRLLARTAFELLGVQTQEGFPERARMAGGGLAILCFGFLIVTQVRPLRDRSPEIWVLTSVTVLPFLALTALSLKMQVLQTRFLIPSLVAAIMLIARIVGESARARESRIPSGPILACTGLLAIMCAAVTIGYFAMRPNIERWNEAVPTIARQLQPGDAVVFLPQTQRVDLEYFYPGDIAASGVTLVNAPGPEIESNARGAVASDVASCTPGRLFVFAHHPHIFDPEGVFLGSLEQARGTPTITELPGRNWFLYEYAPIDPSTSSP